MLKSLSLVGLVFMAMVAGADEYLVADDNCGTTSEQPHLVIGSNYTYPEEELAGTGIHWHA